MSLRRLAVAVGAVLALLWWVWDRDPAAPVAPERETTQATPRPDPLPTRTVPALPPPPAPVAQVLADQAERRREAWEKRTMGGLTVEPGWLQCQVHAPGPLAQVEARLRYETPFRATDPHLAGGTVTLEEGWFQLPANGSAGRLTVKADGYFPEKWHWTDLEPGEIRSCRIALVEAQVRDVRGTVHDPDGLPLEGAVVQGCGTMAESAGDGSFTLTVGREGPCAVDASYKVRNGRERTHYAAAGLRLRDGPVTVDFSDGPVTLALVMEPRTARDGLMQLGRRRNESAAD